jgi:hypothetical protein
MSQPQRTTCGSFAWGQDHLVDRGFAFRRWTGSSALHVEVLRGPPGKPLSFLFWLELY